MNVLAVPKVKETKSTSIKYKRDGTAMTPARYHHPHPWLLPTRHCISNSDMGLHVVSCKLLALDNAVLVLHCKLLM